MTTLYSFNMAVEVDDKDLLFAAAFDHAVHKDALSPDEAREILLYEGEIQVAACLQTLFDPGTSPSGAHIIESEVLILTEYE